MVSESRTPVSVLRWASAPRWVKLLLLFSLSLNLVIAGMLAGAVWSKKPVYRGSSRTKSEISFYSFARTLPKERATALRRAARGAKKDLRPYLLQIVAARRAAAEALAHDPFDAEKLKAAFAKVGAAQQHLKAAATETIVETVATLTPDERRDLGAWWVARKPYLFRDPPPPKPKKKRKSRKRKSTSKKTTTTETEASPPPAPTK